MTVSETIRASVKSSGIELNELTRRTGVPTSVISRLVTGKTIPSGATIDALADYFGLALTPTGKHGDRASASTKPTSKNESTKPTKRTARKGN